jgi:hypothetical protein
MRGVMRGVIWGVFRDYMRGVKWGVMRGVMRGVMWGALRNFMRDYMRGVKWGVLWGVMLDAMHMRGVMRDFMRDSMWRVMWNAMRSTLQGASKALCGSLCGALCCLRKCTFELGVQVGQNGKMTYIRKNGNQQTINVVTMTAIVLAAFRSLDNDILAFSLINLCISVSTTAVEIESFLFFSAVNAVPVAVNSTVVNLIPS